MTSNHEDRWDGSSGYEFNTLSASGGDTSINRNPGRRGRQDGLSDDQEALLGAKDMSVARPSSRNMPHATLGMPTKKEHLQITDTIALFGSLASLALATLAVADERISWYLGVDNYQLVVLGVLLSVMNLCLRVVVPPLFLLLEARYGPSSLQNYDGILRNRLLSSHLSPLWRAVLGAMLALPIGLSVSYKTFTGSESAKEVAASGFVNIPSYCGMFAPPGLERIGNTGLSLFSNATLPFCVASTPASSFEPPVPAYPQSYGFNILLLSNESTAMLDIPQPPFVSAIQGILALGESWNVTATVMAAVASYNNSKREDPSGYNAYFSSFCDTSQASGGAYNQMTMFDDYTLTLMNIASGNHSLQYVGFTPSGPGISSSMCSDFLPWAQLLGVTRQLRNGTWSITRGGIQLVSGSCDETILPMEQQQLLTSNTLFEGVWAMPPLAEILKPFATDRSESAWKGPSIATSLAAMLWSGITILDGAATPRNNRTSDILTTPTPYTMTYEEPLLVIVMLAMAKILYSTPVDKGFGLVSILAGVDRGSLDNVTGAALSGELTESVKLTIQPSARDGKDTIEYRVSVPLKGPERNGRLSSDIVYS